MAPSGHRRWSHARAARHCARAGCRLTHSRRLRSSWPHPHGIAALLDHLDQLPIAPIPPRLGVVRVRKPKLTESVMVRHDAIAMLVLEGEMLVLVIEVMNDDMAAIPENGISFRHDPEPVAPIG